MANGKKSHGGARKGAGRKSRVKEALLLEKLGPMDPLAMRAMEQGLINNDTAVLKLFMSYKYGQPKQEFSGNIDFGNKEGEPFEVKITVLD